MSAAPVDRAPPRAKARRSWRRSRASTIEAHAGLKASRGAPADLREAREILGRDALELTRETFRSAAPRAARSGARRACSSTGRRSRRARASSRRSTSARSRGRATRSFGSPTAAQIPYQRTADRAGQQHRQRERATIETARSALVQRELAPMKRERFQRERDITESLGLGRRLHPDVGAAERRLARRAARRVRAVPARHAGDVGRGLSGVREARARHDDRAR